MVKNGEKNKDQLSLKLLRRSQQTGRVIKNQEDMGREYKNHSDKELRRPENKQDYVNGGYLTTLRKQKDDRSMTREEYEAHAEKKGYYNDLAESKATPYADRKPTGLEATTAIIGLVGGAFFLSANMTGNVIGLSSSSSNILGSVLLVIGLVGCFSWVKSKKKVAKKSKKKK